MAFDYDTNNIFARILRGEIPCQKVLETPHSLAFHDIRPQAQVHVLVIPKGPYATFDHFAIAASPQEQTDFNAAVAQVCRMMELMPSEGGAGYRLISNAGGHGMQEVPHLHFHILAGRPLGRLVDPA